MTSPARLTLWLAAVLLPLTGQAQSSTALDARVQAPGISAPQRGSLVGQYASTAFGPADVSLSLIHI